MQRYLAILCVLMLGCETQTTTGTVSANAGDDIEALVGDIVTLDGNATSGVTSAMRPRGTRVISRSSASATAEAAGVRPGNRIQARPAPRVARGDRQLRVPL